MHRAIAIITARGGSKRIPRKNIRPFCGRPIIHYPIKAALESGCFSEVMVSTDDPEIAALAQEAGANVPFLRSEATSSDYATTVDVVREVVAEYARRGAGFQYACCIYPTAVLISAENLRASGKKLAESGANAVMPVVAYHHPVERALKADRGLLEMIHPETESVRSQDLTKSYYDAGQFYWFRVKEYLTAGGCLKAGALPFEIDARHSQDIDEEADWAYAEFKYQFLQSGKK